MLLPWCESVIIVSLSESNYYVIGQKKNSWGSRNGMKGLRKTWKDHEQQPTTLFEEKGVQLVCPFGINSLFIMLNQALQGRSLQWLLI